MCWRNLCALRVSWGSLQTCEEISADCGVTPKHWIRLRSTLNEGYGMDLTVSDLAIAVSKSEEYVRRRIRQDYLSARREGRRLYVTQLEAARWARESGLHFVSRVSHPQPMGKLQCRTARMTVLAWHPKSRAPVNLFTHVRHRSRDSLGPWCQSDPDESWSCVMRLRLLVRSMHTWRASGCIDWHAPYRTGSAHSLIAHSVSERTEVR